MIRIIRGLSRFLAIMLVISGLLAAIAASTAAQDSTKGAAVFKIPDGYMPVPTTDFRGMIMLDPKKPAGMFVTYPNDNESTETLTKRLLDFIGPMFIHEKSKDKAELTWDTTSLLSHKGDGDGKAKVNVSKRANQEVQVTIYERAAGLHPFLYGYFAMRHIPRKGDDPKFLDEKGQGVKAFEKLWKSFPE